MNIKPRLIHGIGINDADYKVYQTKIVDGKRKNVWICPFYRTWINMFQRCYNNTKTMNSTYNGCSVSKEWYTFSNFKKWMETQDWEGKHLDKDILFPSNKVYSPETCVFVGKELNTFLTDRNACRGDCPIGVIWVEEIKRYKARCRNPFENKQDYLGQFTDPNLAHQAWKKRKHELALQYAEIQTDSRIAEALKTRFLT